LEPLDLTLQRSRQGGLRREQQPPQSLVGQPEEHRTAGIEAEAGDRRARLALPKRAEARPFRRADQDPVLEGALCPRVVLTAVA
jgi:hypothetical protein